MHELDRKHFGWPHLKVQELDDLVQLGRDDIGDEQHAYSGRQTVDFNLAREDLDFLVWTNLIPQNIKRGDPRLPHRLLNRSRSSSTGQCSIASAA
jgi:hypothetical protein